MRYLVGWVSWNLTDLIKQEFPSCEDQVRAGSYDRAFFHPNHGQRPRQILIQFSS